MPPRKRTLTEADINRTSSSAKRRAATTSSSSRAPGKENVPPPSSVIEKKEYEGKSKSELVALCRQKGIPYTGSKAVLVERLEKGQTYKRKRSQDEPPTLDFKWVTMCYVDSDEDEDEDNGGESSAEDFDRRKESCGRKNCVCMKPAHERPGHKWIMTAEGCRMFYNLRLEAMKRDQDVFGEYFYNDFTGYGFQEVVENHLVSFNKEMMKKFDVKRLWSHIESFAFFIPGPGHWYMIDDSRCVQDTLAMIGFAVMRTLQILERRGWLTPDSPVRNLTFVLGRLLLTAMEWPGDTGEPELSWTKAVVRMMDKHHISFNNLSEGIEWAVQEVREEMEDDLSDSEDEHSESDDHFANFKNFDWRHKYSMFRYRYRGFLCHTIGGRNYDLTVPGRDRYRASAL